MFNTLYIKYMLNQERSSENYFRERGTAGKITKSSLAQTSRNLQYKSPQHAEEIIIYNYMLEFLHAS